jgi:uncharacterized cupredoxin-like copper-binding protein
VVVRPTATNFTVVGTIGDKTDFTLLNDSDRALQAQVIALNGHSMTELQNAVANGGALPDWAKQVGTIQAESGKIGTTTLDTKDGGYAILDTTGSAPLIAALERTVTSEAAAAGTESAAGGAGAAAAVPALPAAGPVGSATGTVSVDMKEFAVTANPTSTASGQVTFNMKNGGSVVHELLVIRTDADPAALPQKSGAVDETNAGLEVAGEILNVSAGGNGTVTKGLPAGKYVLICNVPGHYQAGMHTAFTVQ